MEVHAWSACTSQFGEQDASDACEAHSCGRMTPTSDMAVSLNGEYRITFLGGRTYSEARITQKGYNSTNNTLIRSVDINAHANNIHQIAGMVSVRSLKNVWDDRGPADAYKPPPADQAQLQGILICHVYFARSAINVVALQAVRSVQANLNEIRSLTRLRGELALKSHA